MKLSIKILLPLLFAVTIMYSQNWVETDVTEFASIKLPPESELIEAQGKTFYTAEDQFAYYVVSLTRLTQQQSSQVTQKDLPTIYEGVVQGTMSGTDATLVAKKDILIQEIPALEIEYMANANPALPTQRFKRIIYVNRTIITMDFWPATDQIDVINQKKSEYFNSFSIDSVETLGIATGLNSQDNTSIQDQDTAYEMGYEIGYYIGQITFYVLLIAVIVGIVLLVRYFSKKKRKTVETVQKKEKPQIQTSKIICQNCNSENNGSNKYCSTCGYELIKT